MYEVVYRVGSELESQRVVQLLADHDIDVIEPEGRLADPTMGIVSGNTHTLPIAVRADQAELARRILQDHDAPREESIRETDRQIKRLFMLTLMAGVLLIAVFLLLGVDAPGAILLGAVIATGILSLAIKVSRAGRVKHPHSDDEDDDLPDRWGKPFESTKPNAEPRPSEDGTGRGGHGSLK